jgi:vesicle-fusing ATPase
MEMLSAFTAVLHVPNLSKPEHIITVLESSDIFKKAELNVIAKKMHGHKYVTIQALSVAIP